MEEGTLRLILVAWCQGRPCLDIAGWLLEGIGHRGVNSAKVRFRLDLVAGAVGAMAAVGCREGSEARGVSYSLFFPRHPSHPQCGFHSHCLLSWLPASALTLLIYTSVFVGHSIFCLLSCVSYILLLWGFCLFSINIVYEIHINFSSSSFSSTAVVSYFLKTCLFYIAGKLDCLRCFALTILKQCFCACVCLLM